MIQFKGFKPQAMQRIAGTLGYQGDMSGFNDYLNQNPDKKEQMDMYQNKAVQMLQGGLVKMQQGGIVADPNSKFYGRPPPPASPIKQMPQANLDFSLQEHPRLPIGTLGQKIQAPTSYNFTYEEALGRQQQRDVKTPEEQAAINAAIAKGPSVSTTQGTSGTASVVASDVTPFTPTSSNPNVGATTASGTNVPPQVVNYAGESITELQAARALDPALPYGATVQPVGNQIDSS